MNNKEDIVVKLVRHGTTSAQEFNETNWDILSGELPYGINAPTFTTRKWTVAFYYLLHFIAASFFTLFCIMLLALMGFAAYRNLPEVDLFDWAIVIASFLGVWFFARKVKPNWRMFRLIRSLKIDQDTQAQESKVSSLAVRSEAQLAQQFYQQRIGVRIAGFIMVVLSGSALHYLFAKNPDYVFSLFYITPLLFCIGLAALINPTSSQELMHTHGSPSMSWRHMPSVTKLLMVIGVLGCVLLVVQYDMGYDLISKITMVDP